jgi:choline-sulfatase
MTPANLLVLMSDEHNPKFLGAAGHPFIATPNLDALAARGTRFTSAYTPCPICAPARASFAVGRYVHEIGYWDNADGYDGGVPSWHHALRDAGHRWSQSASCTSADAKATTTDFPKRSCRCTSSTASATSRD